MSLTIIQAIPADNLSSIKHQPIRLPSLHDFDYKACSEKLTKILTLYETWTDPLSLRLYKWGVKTLELNLLEIEGCPELQKKLVIRIIKLRTILLANLSRKSPWESPIILEGILRIKHPSFPNNPKKDLVVTDLTFEKRMWEDWTGLTDLKLPSNEFVLAMMEFAESLNFSGALIPTTENRSLTVFKSNEEKKLYYYELIETFLVEEKERFNRSKLRRELKELQIEREILEGNLDFDASREARQKAHETAIRGAINEIKESFQNAQESTHATIKILEDNLEFTQTDLKSTKIELTKQSQRANYLQEQCARQAQEIHALQNRKQKSRCTIS